MKIDFDIDSAKSNKIELLDCQIELILKSLEFYCYTYEFIYPRTHKSKSTEENLRISLVTDTYNQILEQYENPILKSNKKIYKIF